MPKFTIQYEAIERTIEHIDIEAETAEEAKRMVEEYEFDNGHGSLQSSLEWSVENVEVVEAEYESLRAVRDLT